MNGHSKEFGKITRAYVGIGGYQDAQFGLFLTFEGKGWGVSTQEAFWNLERDERTKWTEEQRRNKFADVCTNIDKYLKQAKKIDVAQLVGVPVEITFENQRLTDWRILEEVL